MKETTNYVVRKKLSFLLLSNFSNFKKSIKSVLVVPLLLFILLFAQQSFAQVSVTATAGTTGPTTYTTVNAAFTAINAGTHQGVITISITGNTTEPATAVQLLRSNAPSNYTSITIKPNAAGRVINSAAAPTVNRGVLELVGADNVTIDGSSTVGGTTKRFNYSGCSCCYSQYSSH